MKGIILAGGSGTRLHPLTKALSKQLMPVYDKPMIYYPLSILMLAGIQEVLIISTKEDLPFFKNLLGEGEDIGMRFDYIVQPSPDGLAQAFILGADFIGKDDVSLILGDNIFYGHGITDFLDSAISSLKNKSFATIFGYYVKDPERYGVVEFDDNGQVISIEEKPEKAKSNYAVTGLYFYPNDVISKANIVKPSQRGELEITTLNQMYLDEGRLSVEQMGRGFAWLDTGTHESLLDASTFIATIEKRQGLKVGCIEEIAVDKGYISKEQFKRLALQSSDNQYGRYLVNIAKNIP
ncbi:glucose-1-phosphate thymidylyltransferase RfbA [Candidatus Pseudothioglobus sp. Uisw_086]|jgi:glucose-1-phosphate thymidylyltransferase|uniref:glucose-1-phosphate thymidylyltransferase RfbA n=1 Tax=Candidatus Pseudothioglobus sp. Uisw_086 TaxID=3230998 RepID=UPI003A8465CF